MKTCHGMKKLCSLRNDTVALGTKKLGYEEKRETRPQDYENEVSTEYVRSGRLVRVRNENWRRRVGVTETMNEKSFRMC